MLYNLQKEVADGLNGAHFTLTASLGLPQTEDNMHTLAVFIVQLASQHIHTNTHRAVCISTLENALTAVTTIKTKVLSTKPLKGDTYSAVGDEHSAISVLYAGFGK